MLKFSFDNKEIRIVEVQGIKYVLMRDVMDLLGMKSNALFYLKTDERDRTNVRAEDVNGNVRKMAGVNAEGLEKVLNSTLADGKAKTFLYQRILPALEGRVEFTYGRIKYLEEQVEYEKEARKAAGKMYSEEIAKVAKENGRLVRLVDGLKNDMDINARDYSQLMDMYVDEVNELTDEILKLEEIINDKNDIIQEEERLTFDRLQSIVDLREEIDELRKIINDRDIQIDNLMAENHSLDENNYELLNRLGDVRKELHERTVSDLDKLTYKVEHVPEPEKDSIIDKIIGIFR